MAKYRVAWLPGDGVGKDVMEAARIVLDKINLDAEYIEGDIGWEFWKREGNALPERTKEILRSTDCALFGAITSKPKVEAEKELSGELRGKGLVYSSPIVGLRQEFDLYANVRPCRAYTGNPLNYRDDIDLVVIRENTEGLYCGVEYSPLPDEVYKALSTHPKMKRFTGVPPSEMALSSRIVTKNGCRRIAEAAFKYARKHGRRSVTLVEKPNVLRETGGLMASEAQKTAERFKDIGFNVSNIDAQCMWLLKNPQNYDLLLAGNMFGDIISDLAAQLVGGLGFACSGNIGESYAVFEPTHGSAPKYAGAYKVNPTAMLLSVKMMLEWLGEKESAARLEQSIASVISEGRVRTYDMGGENSTLEMAKTVADGI